MKYKLLIIFFILFSCDSTQNKITKNIENCAENNWLKKNDYKKTSVYTKIRNAKKDLKKFKDRINFMKNEKAFFIDQKNKYEKDRDAAILIKKKIKKEKSYADVLYFEYVLNKRRSSYARRSIDNLKYNAKENSDYYISYENTLNGFTKRIKKLERYSNNEQNRIDDLNTPEGIKKYKKKEELNYKSNFKKYIKPFLNQSLKEKLKDSSFNSQFVNCELDRKNSPIAFDERWK